MSGRRRDFIYVNGRMMHGGIHQNSCTRQINTGIWITNQNIITLPGQVCWSKYYGTVQLWQIIWENVLRNIFICIVTCSPDSLTWRKNYTSHVIDQLGDIVKNHVSKKNCIDEKCSSNGGKMKFPTY